VDELLYTDCVSSRCARHNPALGAAVPLSRFGSNDALKRMPRTMDPRMYWPESCPKYPGLVMEGRNANFGALRLGVRVAILCHF
jgi:hypothetical protein